MFNLSRIIAGLAVLLSAQTAHALTTSVYSTDFESGIDAVWTNGSPATNSTLGKYNGNFSLGGSTSLTLTGLPAHTQLSLMFDLYLFNTWDGNNPTYGPDYFSLSGDVIGSWTFTNHQPEGQSYSGTPDEVYGSGMSSTHVYRDLGPTGAFNEFLIGHAGSTFSVIFGGPTTQSDEWWGIDNVRVSVGGAPGGGGGVIPEPSTLLLVGVGLIGTGLLRKRFKK